MHKDWETVFIWGVIALVIYEAYRVLQSTAVAQQVAASTLPQSVSQDIANLPLYTPTQNLASPNFNYGSELGSY